MQNYSIPSSALETIDRPFCTFFLFINSDSGGGLGTKLLNQQITKLSFQIPIENEKDIRNIDVYFVDMKRKRQWGFIKLKTLNQSNLKTIAVVCGGDGTVIWVVSEFVNYGINLMQTPLTIIPMGTGNDFSRSLFWGGEKTMLLQYNYRSLKKLIRKWLHAQVRQFDIWDMTAQIYPNGKFEKVENGENSKLTSELYQRTFALYFSFGIDGKIGYSFDMHRTSTRMGNLAMYGALGVLKEVTRSKTIDELIESFYIKHRTQNKEDNLCIFKSKFKFESKSDNVLSSDQKTQYITPGLKNILALNIDSYTGGVTGIWQSAKEIFHEVHQRTAPSFSDGKLEIVSFESGTAIALERTIGGFANRIAQHEGPFIFNFRQYPDVQKHRTYLQIDGQFIRFTHPKKVIIEKSKLVPNGKILVLQNDPNFTPYIPQNN